MLKLKKDWNSYWGSFYNLQRKDKYRDFIKKLALNDLLGTNIIDVGCGYRPLISILPDRKYKKIYLDISHGISNHGDNSNNLFIKLDVHNLLHNNRKEFKKYMRKLYKFLGEDEMSTDGMFSPGITYADTIIYSDILNYIDYKSVLRKFYKFLKIGGRNIIFNKINMGYYDLFSPLRPKNNWEVMKFLQLDLRMVIEYREAMPLILGDNADLDQATFIFIAKKRFAD